MLYNAQVAAGTHATASGLAYEFMQLLTHFLVTESATKGKVQPETQRSPYAKVGGKHTKTQTNSVPLS